MAVKKTDKGKVLIQVGNYRVRQVPTHKGHGKQRTLVSTEIAVFKEKRRLEGGFKSVGEAVEYARMLDQIDHEK